MSDGDGSDCGAGGGWLSSWIQSAKEKSSTALNLVKRDLSEFTSTMHDDTVKAATNFKEKLTQENASAATQKVKQGVTTLLGGISKALVVEPDDDYQLAKIVGGEAVLFDRFKAGLHAIQIDPTTYTANPTPEGRYNEWLASFDLESSKGTISELLMSNVEVRALYTQLVPLTVSNNDFWRRYYFKVHLLEEEDARRSELMKRAENVQEDNEKEMGWEDEDDDDITATDTAISEVDQPTKDTCPPRTHSEDDAAELQLRHSALQSPVTDSSATVSSGSVDEVVDVSSKSDAAAASEASSLPHAEQVESSKCGDEGESVVSSNSSEPSGWSTVLPGDIAKSESLIVAAATPDRKSPSDETSSCAKESLDEDWEKDFDVEVTEQELEAAKERLKGLATTQPEKSGEKEGEDWEDW